MLEKVRDYKQGDNSYKSILECDSNTISLDPEFLTKLRALQDDSSYESHKEAVHGPRDQLLKELTNYNPLKNSSYESVNVNDLGPRLLGRCFI